MWKSVHDGLLHGGVFGCRGALILIAHSPLSEMRSALLTDAKSRRPLQKLTQELSDFAKRQFLNSTVYKGGERRQDKRHTMAIPVVIVRLNDENQPVGDPIEVITRDVSPTSIGFFHNEPLDADRLAVNLKLADTEVNLVVLMEWRADAGPFYGMGGAYIEKLDAFPVEIDDS
jgi:hypothetical protein